MKTDNIPSKNDLDRKFKDCANVLIKVIADDDEKSGIEYVDKLAETGYLLIKHYGETIKSLVKKLEAFAEEAYQAWEKIANREIERLSAEMKNHKGASSVTDSFNKNKQKLEERLNMQKRRIQSDIEGLVKEVIIRAHSQYNIPYNDDFDISEYEYKGKYSK